MRLLIALILSFFLIASCQTNERQGTFQNMIKDCDKVEIIFITPDSTLTYSAIDSRELKFFTELIFSANQNVGDSCQPSGKLLYKKNEAIVLEARFSTSGSNNKVSCDYVTYALNGDSYKHRLTYSAGMFIDDVFSQMNNR